MHERPNATLLKTEEMKEKSNNYKKIKTYCVLSFCNLLLFKVEVDDTTILVKRNRYKWDRQTFCWDVQ